MMMANTFSLLLLGATLLTGLVWLLDRFVLLGCRRRRVLKAEAATGKPLDAATIDRLMQEPWWVEQCKGVFPVIAAVLIWRHKANIARLRAGTEGKIGGNKDKDKQGEA